jgi:ribokinase
MFLKVFGPIVLKNREPILKTRYVMSLVVGLGYCSVDYIGVVPHIPSSDEKIRMTKIMRQGGGVTGTAMVTVSRLGLKTAIVWCVGGDENGKFVISDLADEGVDISHMMVAQGLLTPVSYVLVDETSGKRTIAFYYDETLLEHIAKADLNWISEAGALYIDGVHEASIRAAMIAKENRIPVFCSTAEYASEYDRIISYVDVFIASLDWVCSITNRREPSEAARVLLRAGPKMVAVTLGDQGSLCVTKDEVIKKEAFRVNVVDTTGAGDVYSGAFVYGMLQEWPLDFVVEFSNAVAAMKCRKFGGRAGIPKLAEVRVFMREHGKSLLPGKYLPTEPP